MKQFRFSLITPERIVFSGDASAVVVPTTDGEITVLADHVPIIGEVRAGEVRVLSSGGKEESIAAAGGFLQFRSGELSILADTAERAAEIDLSRAEEARKRAEEVRSESAGRDDAEYARVAAVLEKELARIKVARKHLSHRGIVDASSFGGGNE